KQRELARPTEITRKVLERYQRHVSLCRKKDGAPLHLTTQRGRLSVLLGLFGWLSKQNLVLYNPALEIELPRLPQRLPRDVLSIDEVERVLTQPALETHVGLRDRAMLE